MSSTDHHYDTDTDDDVARDDLVNTNTEAAPYADLDDRPPPPPAAAGWPRDDNDVDPAPVAERSPLDPRPEREAVEDEAFKPEPEPVFGSESDAVEDDVIRSDDDQPDQPEPLTAETPSDDDDDQLIGDPEDVRQRWQSVQVGFVDDPRGAIDDAGKLVDEVVELVVSGVSAQRDRLGESWSADDLDTEQLRQALRRYREFLDRLLAV